MTAIRSWLLGMIGAAMVLSVLYGLLPKGSVRSVAKMTGGLILMLVLLRPILGENWEELMWRYQTYEAAIDDEIENYQAENEKKLAQLIQERTAAYISDKAVALGLRCEVKVDTVLRQGIPCPDTVTLNIPRNEKLAQIIAQEMGIAEEKQRWLGE